MSKLNFINWDKELKSIAFLFEFIEQLDLDLYEKLSKENKEFQELTKLDDLRNGKIDLSPNQEVVIMDLLQRVNDWYEENETFFSAMTHPDLVKERIESWDKNDKKGLVDFRQYVDFWWDSDNRLSFIESFEDSLTTHFEDQGINFFAVMRDLFDNDEFLDNIYNFIAYKGMIDTFVEISFTDADNEELICDETLINNVLIPYIQENRILLPLLYMQQNFV